MLQNNKRKEIVYKTNEQTKVWITLIAGLTGFTGREIEVMTVLVTKRQELEASNVKQPYLSQILFSTNSRKEYCSILGITDFNFTNLLGSLRKKKAFTKNEQGVEDIDWRLIPTDEMVIKFIQPND